jgi:hypothetical protein
MAVTIVNTASATKSGTGTTIAVNKPASVASGDLLVIVAGFNTPGTVTSPSGFSAMHVNVGGGGIGLCMCSRVADGTEGASFTVTLASASDGFVICTALRGVDGTTPVLGTGDVSIPGLATATCPAVSWSGASDAVALIGYTQQGVTPPAAITWPSGFTLLLTGNDGFEEAELATDLTAVTSVTTYPSKALTGLNTSAYGAASMYVLKVGAGGGGGGGVLPLRTPTNWAAVQRSLR